MSDTIKNGALSPTPVEQLIAESNVKTGASNEPVYSPLIPQIISIQQVFLILFGILLPITSFTIELTYEMSASMFMDPMPTYWHIILVAIVPISNVIVYFKLRNEESEYKRYLGALVGISFAIAIVYSVLFLPLLPAGIMFVIWMGIGFLPLTPPLALIVSLLLTRRIVKITKVSGKTSLRAAISHIIIGFAITTVIFAILEMPGTITRIYTSDALSNNPLTSLNAIKNIRKFGSESLLLRECYRNSGTTDLFGSFYLLGKPITAAESKIVYYKLTGHPYNAVPKPNWKQRGFSFSGFESDDTFDADRGLQVIGDYRKDLSLSSSRIESSIDADAALAYTEWTMMFNNTGAQNEEARTHVVLPPGGVITRLTLWVNGEEREAAFAGRTKVTAAYQKVVTQRRDPVLITTSGKDTVMVQCFPVPPKGTMKIRFGITSPLKLRDKEHGTLLLPILNNKNFNISENIKHNIWMEAKTPLADESNILLSENPKSDLFAVRGEVTNEVLSKSPPSITINLANASQITWANDPNSKTGEIIEQRIEEKASSAPQRIIIVIDGSKGMKEFIPDIKSAFAKFPSNIEYSLLLPSEKDLKTPDMFKYVSGVTPWGANSYKLFSEQLDKLECKGGIDNVPALTKAWNLAAQKERSIILWIHEPNPVLLSEPSELKQSWKRRPGFHILYDFQTRLGENKIAAQLEDITELYSVIRTGSTGQNLEKLFAQFQNGKEFSFVRSKTNIKISSNLSTKTSSHLARLWAFDQINNSISGKSKINDADIIKLAATYQLVTPVSGAVVLENADQYKDAGLTPVKSGTVPTIPEPEEWAMLIIATIVLGYFIIRNRSKLCLKTS